MKPFRPHQAKAITLPAAAAIVVAILGVAAQGVHAQEPPDFAISEAYLHSLADGNSIIVSIPVRLTHRTNSVHPLADDCEMHLAGKPSGQVLGFPESIVVEPPNLCKFSHDSGADWPEVFDGKVLHRDCVATGFPRIFTEHAKSGESGANPNHVFEIHPATKITCGEETVSFAGYLKFFSGMRSIKPESADECVRNRRISVRYDEGGVRYEFIQTGGERCGNFAVAEVGFVEPKWVHKIGGGHSAIARVSLNGGSRTTLKIYTLEGSEADSWLENMKDTGLGDDRVHLHGLLTYDYFAVMRAVRAPDGTWLKPPDWTPVEFPLAFVVFGLPDEAPWGEDGPEE
jgi:hypothetical protein